MLPLAPRLRLLRVKHRVNLRALRDGVQGGIAGRLQAAGSFLGSGVRQQFSTSPHATRRCRAVGLTAAPSSDPSYQYRRDWLPLDVPASLKAGRKPDLAWWELDLPRFWLARHTRTLHKAVTYLRASAAPVAAWRGERQQRRRAAQLSRAAARCGPPRLRMAERVYTPIESLLALLDEVRAAPAGSGSHRQRAAAPVRS